MTVVSVLNYEGAAATASESDDEAAVCSDGEGVDGEKDLGGPAVGVPSLQASPRMGHALLSLKGAEGLRSLHQHWRLGDHIDDTDAHRSSSGESHDLMSRCGHLSLVCPPRPHIHTCVSPVANRNTASGSEPCSRTQAPKVEAGLGAGPRQDVTTCSLFIGQVRKGTGLEVLVQSQLEKLQVSPAPERHVHRLSTNM